MLVVVAMCRPDKHYVWIGMHDNNNYCFNARAMHARITVRRVLVGMTQTF